MLLKGIARAGIFPATLILIGAFLHGCNSDQDVHYANNAASQPVVESTPKPTPNPDQAAGLITRFYRDADSGTKAAFDDVTTVVSPDFLRTHHDDIVADYGFIHDPKIQIRSVHDRVVSYTMDYVYVSEKNAKFYWERSGRWTLNHGSASGWVLDNDSWDSIHLTGFSLPNETTVMPVQDTAYSDGRHEFTFDGERFAFSASETGWQVKAIAIPQPAAPSYNTTVDEPTPPPGFVSDTTDTTADSNTDPTAVADTNQTHFDDPQTAQEKCPSDTVVWVNTRSGVFHLPGTRWYGATENGTYECEADAFAEGDRQSRNGQ